MQSEVKQKQIATRSRKFFRGSRQVTRFTKSFIGSMDFLCRLWLVRASDNFGFRFKILNW